MNKVQYLQQMKRERRLLRRNRGLFSGKVRSGEMEIVVVLYIVGIALIMGYPINRYPRERVAIIFLCAIVVLQVIQKCLHQK